MRGHDLGAVQQLIRNVNRGLQEQYLQQYGQGRNPEALSQRSSGNRILPDDMGGAEWPDWCATAARTTDAHLLLLAQRHTLHLATLDAGIPGAMLLPVIRPSTKR